jgi:hypothetical protein
MGRRADRRATIAGDSGIQGKPGFLKIMRSQRARAYHRYLQSGHWRALRADAIARKENYCALTGERLKPGRIQVHHLRYRRDLKDTPTTELCLLSKAAHSLLHYYVKVRLISGYDMTGLMEARLLFTRGVGPKKILRLLRPKPGKIKLPEKKKKKRAVAGWFGPPRRRWSQCTEQQRHEWATKRNSFGNIDS